MSTESKSGAATPLSWTMGLSNVRDIRRRRLDVRMSNVCHVIYRMLISEHDHLS